MPAFNFSPKGQSMGMPRGPKAGGAPAPLKGVDQQRFGARKGGGHLGPLAKMFGGRK